MPYLDEDREPLLPPSRFTRQKSIRYPKNLTPRSDYKSSDILHYGSLKGRPTYLSQTPKLPERDLRLSEPRQTSCRTFDPKSSSVPAPDYSYLPPRPPSKSSEDVLRKYNREFRRPSSSFNHDSDGHVHPSRHKSPSPSPTTDGARRYLDSIRQTQLFSQGSRQNSFIKEGTPIREGATSPSFDRTSRPGSLRGFSRYGLQENEARRSPSTWGKTFVSERKLESLRDPRTHGSKSGTTTPQTSTSPSLSRRCRSVTRDSPTEERCPSFSQSLMERLRRRSLSPSRQTLTPQGSPTPSRRSRKTSGDRAESPFKRHGSLPIPRKPSEERSWRSNSVRLPHAQAGEMRANMSAMNNIISSRRESEECFALLPTPPSDNVRVQSPPANASRTLSNYSSLRKPPLSRPLSREMHDSSSSTSSSTDEAPSPRHTLQRINGFRSRFSDTDLIPKRGELSMAMALPTPSNSSAISSRRNRDSSEICDSPDSTAGNEIGLLSGLNSRDSMSSIEENYSSPFRGDVLCVQDCFADNTPEVEDTAKQKESHADHLQYLIENDKEYLLTLDSMLNDYQEMCQKTPSHIRQHFDVIFKQVGLIKAFQGLLHEAIRDACGTLVRLAEIFRDAQFEVYGKYMVMTPAVQKELYRYSSHFDEHFPNLKRNILKPSMRINFYAMALDGMKKHATERSKAELQKSIEFLNHLKRQANTEMTLSTVVNSPVDLRLGGEMLFIGELTCLSGGPLQKKKYSMILFENMLVVVSSKMSYFKYKVHYRSEQLYEVESIGHNEFTLSVLPEGQLQTIYFKFKAKSLSLRDQWIEQLNNIADNNKSSSCERPRPQLIPGNTFGLLLPLSLFSVYPQLRVIMEDRRMPEKLLSVEEACQELIHTERKFILQLETLTHPEVLPPPENLNALIQKFHFIYKHKILPDLERAKIMGAQELLSCLMRILDSMEIYSDYMLIRSQLTLQLDKDVRAKLYISPVQRLEYYIIWLRQMALTEEFRERAQTTERKLCDYVMNAQIRLLTETIRNGRVDFRRSGNLIRNDALEVRTRKKGFRQGGYQALLFQKVIILTKARPPFYEYICDIWLDQLNLGPPCASASSFKLEVRQGGTREPITYEFQAQSEAVKQEWTRCLHQELVCQALKIRRRSASYF